MRGLEGFSAQRTRMKLAFLFATLALSTALPARAGITRDVSRPPPSVALPFDHVAFHGVRLSKEELDSLIGAPEACSSCGEGVLTRRHRHTDPPDDPVIHPQPEQIHLAMNAAGSMEVSWVDPRKYTTVDLYRQQGCAQWGLQSGEYPNETCSAPAYYATPGYESGLFYHSTIASGVAPSTEVFYRVGSDDLGWSSEFSFITNPPRGDLPYRLGLVGDLGQTINSLHTLEHLEGSDPQSVLLVGDLSYADTEQPRWDTYAQLVQPYATSRAWMVTEGNHEMELIKESMPFLAYEMRYWVPHKAAKSPSKLFYSYEVGPAHIIMLGSYEAFHASSPQHLWLQSDLESIDRSVTPWVVVGVHAPWYNSNTAHQDEFSSFGMKESFEQMLYESGVDVVFSGHVHAYERGARIFNGVRDDCGPAYINIGDGGNREGLATNYQEPQPDWSEVREPSYGHGVLEMYNSTHALWQWHRNQDSKRFTADDVWLVKDPDCPNFFVSGTAGAQAPSAWSLDITDALLSDGTLGDSNPGPWGVLEDGSVVGEPDQVLTHTLSDEKFASSGVKPKARGVGGAAGESVGAPESGGRQQGWSNAGMDGERWRAGTGGAGGIGGGHILAAGGAHVGRRMDPGRGRFTEF